MVYLRSTRPSHRLIRPIVSDLSAFLANILSPLTGNLNFTVKNSAHLQLASTIASEKIQKHETMVSFDVGSLFTNIQAY